MTRPPAQPGAYGDYLVNAQGEDVVAGIRNTLSLDDLAQLDPESHRELMKAMRRLETHYRDLCDVEFTVERGKLWMLQTRVGKRTPAAAFRIATQLVDEHLITLDEALHRVTGAQLALLMFPQFDRSADRKLLTQGMAASPGAAVGRVVFDSADRGRMGRPGRAGAAGPQGDQPRRPRRHDRRQRHPHRPWRQDLARRRGRPRHGQDLRVRRRGTGHRRGGQDDHASARSSINEGDQISIDGSTGEVFLGSMPVVASPVETYIEEGMERLVGADDATAALVRAVDRVLTHADQRRRLGVRANADTPEDATRARKLGAQGIGLCRTEHMFLGTRRALIERLILADSRDERDDALDALLPLQRKDFIEILEEMDGLPVTIRLLDPPLHEFLPDMTELSVKVALERITATSVPRSRWTSGC